MPTGSIAVAVIALIAVIGLLRLLQFAVTRGWTPLAIPRGADDRHRATLVHVLRLDARRRLHLVRCVDRHVLILTGGRDDIVVGWLPGDPP